MQLQADVAVLICLSAVALQVKQLVAKPPVQVRHVASQARQAT